VSDEQVHALVGDGRHGKTEPIQDFFCQACHTKFSARRNTVLYRLKTSSQTIERVLWLLALGVEISALEEVYGISEGTIRTWLCRSGEQGQKFHERWLVELELVHVQLDELWAEVKHNGQELWVWVASDAQTKLIPVIQLGGRTQAVAYSVVHELNHRLRAGCIPVFSTDGLKHYFYALTSHFGMWQQVEGEKKPVWVLLNDFVYGRVLKVHRRRKLVRVERQILCGDKETYRTRLKAGGLSGQINTSYIERINLTLRRCISKLARRTWGLAQYTPELIEHIEWWRVYYHFVRYHESLKVALAEPIRRKGKQRPLKYQRKTTAMAAGLTRRRWTVKEVISYPLP
jgi:IS1 family transposase